MRIWKEMKFLVFLGINSVILQILQCIVLAGPVRRSSRMIREVYPEIETEKLDVNQAEVCIVGDVVYGAEEPVPADQPCLKCKCEPPGVQCETTRCIKKPGCKAIHKPNECCPEYQCECEHKGRVYANGERLETPAGGECKVCYCRGGELQCAEVSCYIRTDCEGRTVPGQCCPKYDHCPPREPIFGRVPYTTPAMTGSNFDLLSLNSSVENQLTTSMNNIQDDDASVQAESEEQGVPNITIQEIIPEIKEIPITGPPKREISVLTHGQDLEGKSTHRFHSKDDVSDTETESSEISEIYHHPPPILKIGDQLLVLKKGELIPKKDISTPRPVITVIGAEGLQRGTEDSGETHEMAKTNCTEAPTVSDMSGVLIETSGSVEATTDSIVDFLVNLTTQESALDYTTLRTESISDKVKQNIESTSDVYTNETVSTVISLLEEQNTSTVFQKWYEEESSASYYVESSMQMTEASTPASSTEASKSKHEDEVVAEQNPEYPPIPDIMSPQNLDEDSDLPHSDEAHLNVSEGEKSINQTMHPLINTKASLPSIILESVAPLDSIQEEDLAEIDQSKETAEEPASEESGEFATSPSSYIAPMLSVEDASVESIKSNSSELVEFINVTEKSTVREDVEIVDPHLPSTGNRRKFTYEKDAEVITQLNDDLKTTPSNINYNKTANEDAEAEASFRELLEEATSSKPPQQVGSVENQEKESVLLQRVSEAIMKYQAKESKESLDASILGILRDFFNSQYKYYEKRH